MTQTQSQTKQKLSLDHVTLVGTNPLALENSNWPAMLASKLGVYDKYGLTVDSVGTSGSLEALSAFATGKAEFAALSAGVGVVAKGNGTDLKYIFMNLERDPFAVYTLEKNGIKIPKDLEGKTMGISFASAAYATMSVFGKAAGFDYTKVKYVNAAPAQVITFLMSGQIDFTMTYLTNYYNNEAAAIKAGQKLVVIPRYNYLDIYGSGIITSDSFIRQHADVVKAFVDGYAYGLQYMINNPKDAATLLTSMMTGVDQESIFNNVRTHSDFKFVFPRQSGQPYGIMDDKTWNATISISVQYGGAKAVVPKDIYTNEYVPAQYTPKTQMIHPTTVFYADLYTLACEKLAKPTTLTMRLVHSIKT